jgi:hypothetical protein
MRWIEPIRLDAHVGASAAEATRMALPPQDPRLPRMPSWLFIAVTAWVAFIAYIAQIRHIWWGYAGSAATIVVALALRKRWRAPASVEHAAARLEKKMGGPKAPGMWAGIGYAWFGLGLIMAIVSGGGLVAALVVHNYENLWGKVIALAMSLGLAGAGRWLIRNRRQPFTPAT